MTDDELLEQLRLARTAKSKVKRWGWRALTTLSAREIMALCVVADLFLGDEVLPPFRVGTGTPDHIE